MSSGQRRHSALLRSQDQRVVGVAMALATTLLLVNRLSGSLVRAPDQPGTSAHQTIRFSVDVNSAPWPELAQLPGVGETLARRIVEWREQHGPFTSLDQLKSVRGLGRITLRNIGPSLLPIAPIDAAGLPAAASGP